MSNLNTILQTERLIIQPVSIKDLDLVHELHSLPESDEFNTLGIPESVDQTKSIILKWIASTDKKEGIVFKINLKASSKFIGLIAINLSRPKYQSGEVWYKLHPESWNQGYATEALGRLLDFGFKDLNLHRIEAGCAVDNIGSIRVLEKVGMTREGRMRQILPLKTGWSDNFHYAILATD